MRSYNLQAFVLLAATASVATAKLTIKNSCSYPIYVKENNAVFNVKDPFRCDMGPNKGPCPKVATDTEPWTIQGGSSTTIDMYKSNGTSVKISREKSWEPVPKITQFEYTQTPDTFFWDLSDLDGKGNARVGSPFENENVMAYTNGNPGGSRSCIPLKCKKNEICKDAYQTPDQTATRGCPAATNDFNVEFCVSDSDFDAKKLPHDYPAKRSVHFRAMI